jgi:hypothetical protein
MYVVAEMRASVNRYVAPFRAAVLFVGLAILSGNRADWQQWLVLGLAVQAGAWVVGRCP